MVIFKFYVFFFIVIFLVRVDEFGRVVKVLMSGMDFYMVVVGICV